MSTIDVVVVFDGLAIARRIVSEDAAPDVLRVALAAREPGEARWIEIRNHPGLHAVDQDGETLGLPERGVVVEEDALRVEVAPVLARSPLPPARGSWAERLALACLAPVAAVLAIVPVLALGAAVLSLVLPNDPAAQIAAIDHMDAVGILARLHFVYADRREVAKRPVERLRPRATPRTTAHATTPAQPAHTATAAATKPAAAGLEAAQAYANAHACAGGRAPSAAKSVAERDADARQAATAMFDPAAAGIDAALGATVGSTGQLLGSLIADEHGPAPRLAHRRRARPSGRGHRLSRLRGERRWPGERGLRERGLGDRRLVCCGLIDHRRRVEQRRSHRRALAVGRRRSRRRCPGPRPLRRWRGRRGRRHRLR